MTRLHRQFAPPRAGFSLVEVLVSIALTAVMLAMFSGVLATVGAFKRNDFRFQAANFVREEIDALHAIPYAELIDQADGAFLGLAFTRGAWQVKGEPTAPSGSQVMELTAATAPSLIEETGLLVEPTDYHDDFTFTVKVRTKSASPLGWGTAVAFRYRDASNHYRFRLTNGGYALDRVLHGTVKTLWAQSTTVNTNSWYSLAVRCSGSTIDLWSNGSHLTSTVDTAFSDGDIALMSLNGALLQADDVTVSQGGEVGNWKFDSDPVGTMPTDWQRFVYFDLPSGRGTLTIADYRGLTGLKQVTATVTWDYLGLPQTVVGTTIIADTD